MNRQIVQQLMHRGWGKMKQLFENLRQYVIAHRNSDHHVAGIPVAWWLAGICLFALIVHAPLFHGQFTNYDDGIQITQFNDVTHANASVVKKLLTTNFEGKNSNPMYMSFVANWYLTPGSYRGFVTFNLALLVGLILIFHRFSKLFIATPKWALLATTLFAVHSAKAEIVGWMSARCHYMGMPFFLGAFIFWDMYMNAISKRSRTLFFCLAIACAALAILNKSVFIAVVPLIILFDIFKRRKFDFFWFLDKLPLAAVVIGIFKIGGKVSAVTDRTIAKSTSETVLERLPSAINIVAQYFKELFVPGATSICADAKLAHLKSLFDSTNDSSLTLFKLMPITNIAILLAMLLLALWVWKRHREPIPFFGMVAIGVALVPVLGFIPFWVDFAFRFLWIPMVFFCVAITAMFRLAAGRISGRSTIIVYAVLGAYIVWHSAQSFVISQTFDTTPTYWENCAKHFPESKICLQKMVASSMDTELKKAIAAQWQMMKVKSTKTYDHKMTGLILADLLARAQKPQLASLFYERALVWKNANAQGLKRAREYIKKHPITKETRDAVMQKRWEVLW